MIKLLQNNVKHLQNSYIKFALPFETFSKSVHSLLLTYYLYVFCAVTETRSDLRFNTHPVL